MPNKTRFCYWSIGNKSCSFLLNCLVRSAREKGVSEDIHVWTDRKISGAINHFMSRSESNHLTKQSPYLYDFKYRYLKKMLDYPYDAYVFLDSDILFVRKPDDLVARLDQDPVHVFFEGALTDVKNLKRSDWYGCPMEKFVSMMRDMGVRTNNVYGVNGGLWIIRRDYVKKFCELVEVFYGKMYKSGYVKVNDEPPLSYAAHMLSCPERHLLKDHLEDYGNYNCVESSSKLPDGTPWDMDFWFSNERYSVNPSLAHCFRSKELLLKRMLTPSEKIERIMLKAKNKISSSFTNSGQL